jgi:hypothetical protein
MSDKTIANQLAVCRQTYLVKLFCQLAAAAIEDERRELRLEEIGSFGSAVRSDAANSSPLKRVTQGDGDTGVSSPASPPPTCAAAPPQSLRAPLGRCGALSVVFQWTLAPGKRRRLASLAARGASGHFQAAARMWDSVA